MLLIQVLVLATITLYQAIAVSLEDRRSPPGQLIDVGGYRLHLRVKEKLNQQSFWSVA